MLDPKLTGRSGQLLYNAVSSVHVGSGLNSSMGEELNGGDELNFKCKVCGKGFKHRRSLNRHVKLHSGEKNFQCPYCATAFARSDHLKAHIRTHNNSKPFRCAVCQCGYSTQAALKVHIAHHHSKSKFKCVLCNDLEFHSQLALEGHVYTKHSKENAELDVDELGDKTGEPLNMVGSMPRGKTGRHVANLHRVQLADINNYNSSAEDMFDAEPHGYEDDLDGDELESDMTAYGLVKVSQNSSLSSNEGAMIEFDGQGTKDPEQISDNDEDIAMETCSPGKQTNQVEKNKVTETATFIDNYGEDDDQHEILESKENMHEEEPLVIEGGQEDINNEAEENPQTVHSDEDEVIIEEALSSGDTSTPSKSFEQRLKQVTPRVMASMTRTAMSNQRIKPPTLLPAPGNPTGLNRGAAIPVKQVRPLPAHHINNTYCEMCNARFSNVESFMAHMRNCHPNIQFGQARPGPDEQNKMPYLTSVLGKSGNVLKTSAQITPVINKLGNVAATANGGIIIPMHPVAKTTCTIPNCNCSPLPGDYGVEGGTGTHEDSYYAIKETHYTCAQCSLTLTKLSDYINHLKQEHCVEVFRCILCKQMQLFDNLNLLKEHFFQVHQSVKCDYYRCRGCPPSASSASLFTSLEELNAHVQTSHSHSPLTPTHSSRSINMHLRMAPPPPSFAPYSYGGGGSGYNSGGGYNGYSKCFKCTYCDSDFAQQNSLNQHIQMVHKVVASSATTNPASTTFACQYCRNTFNNRAQLERHVRIHVSSIDLKCNICDRQFSTQELLNQHKLTHCKTFNSSDSAVGKAVDGESSMSLPVHNGLASTSSNTSTMSCICVYCKQTIEDETQFKEHFKRHNNIGQAPGASNPQQSTCKVNSFICIVCRQTLSSNNEYNLHMRHHLRRINPNLNGTKMPEDNLAVGVEKPADTDQSSEAKESSKPKCSKCLVKFESWPELNDHMAEAHPTESSVKQPVETAATDKPKQASVKEERRSPVQVVEPTTVVAPVTAPAGPIQTDLCEICSSKFDSNSKLQAHLLIKHEFANLNVYTCPVCDESYSRPEVLLAHTNVHGLAARIYKCTHCSLAFVFKSQLINHSFFHQSGDNVSSSSPHQKQPQQQQPKQRQLHITTVVSNNSPNPGSYPNKSTNLSQPTAVGLHNPLNRPRFAYGHPGSHYSPQQRLPQHPHPHMHQQHQFQRFKCNECNIEFNAFRVYQMHVHSVHGRSIPAPGAHFARGNPTNPNGLATRPLHTGIYNNSLNGSGSGGANPFTASIG